MIATSLSVADGLGYTAATLVFLTFAMQSMPALRALAIASNLLFIAYALVAGLNPVLLLHAALLPLNVWRLWQSRQPAQVQPARTVGMSRAAPILNTPLTRATTCPSARTRPCTKAIERVMRSTCASPSTQAPSDAGAR